MNRDEVLGEWRRAALSAHDVIAESHSSVRGLFGKHLIRTGAIERTWSKQLAASLDDRLAADYDAATFFSTAEARRECRSARAFVGRIRRYLLTSGFTDDELTTEGQEWLMRSSRTIGICRRFRGGACGSARGHIWSRTTPRRPGGARTPPAAGRASCC